MSYSPSQPPTYGQPPPSYEHYGEPETPQMAAQAQVPLPTMFCTYCGAENPNQATACASCGRQLERAASTPVQPLAALGPDTNAPEQPPPRSQASSTPPPPPFVTQRTEPQGPFPPPPISTVQQGQRRRRFPAALTVLLLVLAVLLIGGSGLIYYATVYQPNLKHAQATATAVARLTGTAHAEATTAAQATAAVVATQTALQAIYTQATSGKPTLNDPLSHADIIGWDVYSDARGFSCTFKGGAYHSVTTANSFTPCFAEATNFSNFAYQVEITIVSGQTGGMVFRANNTNLTSYFFNISTDGTYLLHKFTVDSSGTAHDETLVSGSTSIVNTVHGQSNLIAVVARGNDFYLYVNKQYVDHASDSTFHSGQIGVFSWGIDTSGAEAMFRHAQVWKL